jgi:hypothetical protein
MKMHARERFEEAFGDLYTDCLSDNGIILTKIADIIDEHNLTRPGKKLKLGYVINVLYMDALKKLRKVK